MNPILSFVGAGLVVFGLIGQGFEMRKMKASTLRDEDLASTNFFINRRNLKWYAIIGAGLIVWYLSNSLTSGSI